MLMRVNGLEKFCKSFRDQSVDGSLLSMVESADDLTEIGVNTTLHRRKLYNLIRNWKESTQMVTREELEEAEKMQLSYMNRASTTSTSSVDDVRSQFAEHIRVSLSTAAFMLMRRMRGIYKGYLIKASPEFRQAHWQSKKAYRDPRSCADMAQLDSTYAIMTTLYAFGRYLAFHMLANKNMSVFMDDNCVVNMYPSLTRAVEFSLSGEGIDLRTVVGSMQHPKWELGKVPSGIFQVLGYEQIEIGESMLVPDEKTELGCRCLSYVEFKRKFEKERSFRIVFSRLHTSCKMLHTKESVHLYCEDAKKGQLLLANEYRGRVVWLHNQLCTLVQQLDHNLMLRSRALNVDNQQVLQDRIEKLIVEQEIQDLMRGYQRKLMCDSVFMRWCTEAKTVEPKAITCTSKVLVGALSHAKIAVETQKQFEDLHKRNLSVYGADVGKRVLTSVGHDRVRDLRTRPSGPEPKPPGLRHSVSCRFGRFK